MSISVFAVVPVKELMRAKERLSTLLDPEERKRLVLSMLEDVVTAAEDAEAISRIVVVSLDSKVLGRASSLGATILEEKPPPNLNSAIKQAANWCVRGGASSALIMPVDIPLVSKEDIDGITTLGIEDGREPSIVISPSRDGCGTNALMLTPPTIVPTHYGPNSFQLHVREGLSRGVKLDVYESPRVALDIDTRVDLADFMSVESITCTYRFLSGINFQDRLTAQLSRKGGSSPRRGVYW